MASVLFVNSDTMIDRACNSTNMISNEINHVNEISET